MTSDSQHAGREPDETPSGSEWAPFGGERPARPAARRGEAPPPEFAWAPPSPPAWSTPGNSWTVAYSDPASDRSANDGRGFPPDWSAPAESQPARGNMGRHPVPPGSEWEGRPAVEAPGQPDEHSGWSPQPPAPDPLAPPVGPFPPTADAPWNRPPQGGPSGEHGQSAPGSGHQDFPRHEQPADGVGRAAVPPVALPPQQTRIPGASLAADPPAPYDPPAGRYQHTPPARSDRDERYAFADPTAGNEWEGEHTQPAQHGRDQQPAIPRGQGRVQMVASGTQPPAWNPPPPYVPGSSGDAPQSADRPLIPQPREPEQSGVSGRVSLPQPIHEDDRGAEAATAPVTASAAVPAASRVSPPDDYVPAGRMSAAQPRVYGRPPAAEPGDQEPPRHGTDDGFPAGLSDDDRFARPTDDDYRFGARPGGDDRFDRPSEHDRFPAGPSDHDRFAQPGEHDRFQAGPNDQDRFAQPSDHDRFPAGPNDHDRFAQPSDHDRFPAGPNDHDRFAARPTDDDPSPAGPPAQGRARVAGGWAGQFGDQEVPTDRAAGAAGERTDLPYPPPPGSEVRENGERFAPPGYPGDLAARAGGPATGTARPVSPVADRATDPADAASAGTPDTGWPGEAPHAQQSPWGEPAAGPLGGPTNMPDDGRRGAWDGAGRDARASAWPDSPADARTGQWGPASGTAQVGAPGAGHWSGGAPSAPDSAMPWPLPDNRQPERSAGFRPNDAPPTTDAPSPQVRNARVLAMVLVAAMLLLAIPLGTLWLLGRTGDESFNPSVGSCVKQEGGGAAAAACGDAGAYKIVSKVNDPAKCADPKQPHIVLPDVDGDNVLCLQPAANG